MEHARGVVGAETGGGGQASFATAPGSTVQRTTKWAAKFKFLMKEIDFRH